jgi:MFS family permease
MNARLRSGMRRTFRSLRVRNFRLFFLGQLVSVTGTWMQTVAQNWLVLSLTGSGVALGVTVALQFLPTLLFGLWGGLVADRFDKRRVLFATQVVPAVLAAVMGALVAAGSVQLWMVYVLAFLLGVVHMVDMPTRHAFVMEMVGPHDIANAVALNSAMFNTGRLMGPAAAGVLIATVGIAPSFLINAVSYLAVIAALSAMRPDDLFRQAPAPRGRGDVRSGLRYVWGSSTLRRPLLLVAVIGTFGLNFAVVLPLLARFTFGGGAAMYGMLTSLMSLGSLLGALFAASRSRPTGPVMLRSAAAFGALTATAAAIPSPVALAPVLVAAGAAMMVFLATANATLQLNAVPAMRGRVMALYGLVFLGTTPLGGPLLGWIGESWGAPAALAFAGGVSLAAAAAAMVASRNAGVAAGADSPPALVADEAVA